MNSPLETAVLFWIGPVPITQPVVTTWVMMAMIVAGCYALTRNLSLHPGRRQAALELLVTVLDTQIRETMSVSPDRYRTFLGGLFLFILIANWSSLIPGVEPPTANLETDAALALLVFVAVIVYGIRAGGVGGYLRSFAMPTPLMIPLNLVETLTRSFSLLIRLFGNIMSGVFIIGIVLSLAGLFVPIPFMALDLLTGLVQAYIFTVLAMVFIAAAVAESQPSRDSGKD
ncbi:MULTISPECIES: F0F1 ATP synthase subunit A [Thioclava]|uniref:F0F1 ATP synthase subunit A n=1 Tax=Thioclava TaxID=285107 RepID=UPI000B542F7A|nr:MULTISPECIES: F0F1 ATP synthase subunit A [Thioclava]OWY05897.1 ATP synthase F0 subunit A [Thioclava sp. F1Mire-8]OWY13738.1 ATP synthase F0 subunit A [Thioclava sp. F34-6]WGT51176.1 F0F1 ATP synthase subunit A [Thioclava nitratireducens]